MGSSNQPVVARTCDTSNLDHDSIPVWNMARRWSVSTEQDKCYGVTHCVLEHGNRNKFEDNSSKARCTI